MQFGKCGLGVCDLVCVVWECVFKCVCLSVDWESVWFKSVWFGEMRFGNVWFGTVCFVFGSGREDKV